MTATEFIQFKYQHTDAVTRSPQRLAIFGVTLLVALIIAKYAFPFGLIALTVPLILWFAGKRLLQLGPRYLLCGSQIVYYANVRSLTLSRARGTLHIKTANGQSWTLERDKFPTGARREPKITANKTAKFDKVSEKIAEKVRKANPGVEQIGF